MNARSWMLILIPLIGLAVCYAGEKHSGVSLSDETSSKEIEKMLDGLEFVSIEVDKTDVSWGKFLELYVKASIQNQEVLLQDGMRTLSLSFTRPWRKEVGHEVLDLESIPMVESLGKLEDLKSLGLAQGPESLNKVEGLEALGNSEVSLVVCDFDENGVGTLRGKKNIIEDYIKSNPNQRIVIVCFFSDDMRLKGVFFSLFRLASFENVIDFAFPQE